MSSFSASKPNSCSKTNCEYNVGGNFAKHSAEKNEAAFTCHIPSQTHRVQFYSHVNNYTRITYKKSKQEMVKRFDPGGPINGNYTVQSFVYKIKKDEISDDGQLKEGTSSRNPDFIESETYMKNGEKCYETDTRDLSSRWNLT